MQNKLKWMWLPLSLGVLLNYIFSRGLVMFAKTPLSPPSLAEGLVYYFIASGLIIGLVGILCDKYNARKMFFLSTIAGAVSLLLINSIPLAFGILFGAAAATAKLGPMTATTKLVDKKTGLNLVPQSIAKSAGGIIFPLIYVGLLTTIGWSWSMALLALVYLLTGVFVYFTVPDDLIEGWNLKAAATWVKSWEVWAFTISFSLSWVCWMLTLRDFVPIIRTLGYSVAFGAFMLGLGQWAELVTRLPAGWTGDRIGYGKAYIIHFIFTMIAYPLMGFYPFVAIFLINIGSGFGTPSMFPLLRRLVGKSNVATLMGIVYVIAYLGTGITFGFKK